jgi:hypothetical protein
MSGGRLTGCLRKKSRVATTLPGFESATPSRSAGLRAPGGTGPARRFSGPFRCAACRAWHVATARALKGGSRRTSHPVSQAIVFNCTLTFLSLRFGICRRVVSRDNSVINVRLKIAVPAGVCGVNHRCGAYTCVCQIALLLY